MRGLKPGLGISSRQDVQRAAGSMPRTERSPLALGGCHKCDGSGWVVRKGQGLGVGMVPCGCFYLARMAKRRAEAPARFNGATLTGGALRPNQATVGGYLRAALRSEVDGGGPVSSYLCGDSEAGKTWLAWAYALDRTWLRIKDRTIRIYFFTERDLRELLLERRRWDKPATAPWSHPKAHLIIDDFGRSLRHGSQEWLHDAITGVVDQIYANQATLTITSNWTLQELEEDDRVDSVLSNRILSLCGPGYFPPMTVEP